MKKRFYNIEFFRIWFTLTIVYGHMIQHWMMPQFGELPFFDRLFRHTSYSFGYMCEAFFIISGFFMFCTFVQKPSFVKMITGKLVRLWPVVAFALFCSFVLSLFGIGGFEKYACVLDLSFLNCALTNAPTNVGHAWYVTSLFWACVFYYLLDNVLSDGVKIYVFSILTFLFYSILLNKIGLYDQPQVFCGLLSIPLIRALAGMGLGYIIGYAYNAYRECQRAGKTNLCFCICEILFLALLFKLSIMKKVSFAFPVMLVSFVFLFIDFLLSKGIVARLVDKKVFGFIGRYSFSVYMMQWIGFLLANKFLWHHPRFGVEHYPVLNIIGGGGGMYCPRRPRVSFR